MAKDDMNVIIYKILRYMYKCMKNGKRPEFAEMCYDCKMFSIPESYWNQIMFELIEAGYVRGFLHRITKDGVLITMTSSAAITMAGVNFLEENSGMHRAKEFLGKSFEIVLNAIL